MTVLVPRIAAELASDVYLVQNPYSVRAFFSRPEFSSDIRKKAHLTATVGFRIANVKDGFGVCAVGAGEYKNDVFLIFRGSTNKNNMADWVSNARIGVEFSKTGRPVHLGFNHIFTSMLPDIEAFMAENHVSGTIHCLGHSLGGAVATLAADWVKNNFGNTVKLYTFGAPRPGLLLFAQHVSNKLQKKNIYRTYHATDPVPMIPVFPFMHPPLPGYGHCIPSNENILSADAHDRVKYINSVRFSSWEDLEKRKPPYSAESVVEQWLESANPVNPADPKVWQWIDASLNYVIKKVVGVVFVSLQGIGTGLMTIADKIAWVLQKGIDLSLHIGRLVFHLMRKIMQALSMAALHTDAEITQLFIREILVKLMMKMNTEAQMAIYKYN